QIASPAFLYDAPATPFVATFIGAMNTLEGVVVERRGLDVLVDAAGLAIVAQHPQQQPVEPGMKVTIVFRPEAVGVGAPGLGQVGMGRIKEVAFPGGALRGYTALSECGNVMADIPRTTGGLMTEGSNFTSGEPVTVRFADGATRIVAMHNI